MGHRCYSDADANHHAHPHEHSDADAIQHANHHTHAATRDFYPDSNSNSVRRV